jgi:hypothetical protein
MQIKLTSFANLILFVLLPLSVSGCGSSSFVQFELRGHVYKIPSRYVVMKPPSLLWVGLRKGSDNTTRGVLLSMPVEELKKRVPSFIAYPWANDLSIMVNEEKSLQKYVESLINNHDIEKVVSLDGMNGIYKYVTSYGPWYITKEINLRGDYDSLLAVCTDKERNEFSINECTFWFESGSAFFEYDADLGNAVNHREIERAIADWLSSWEVHNQKPRS